MTTYTQDVRGLSDLIAASNRVVALTGAGISTASGMQDFRSQGGLWDGVDPMKECSMSAFLGDPVRFWEFYKARLTGSDDVIPNAAHTALVDLEAMGKMSWILTQNIDGLHQKAGSSRVSELHGSPATVVCPRCSFSVSWDEALTTLQDTSGVPRCPFGHAMKPNIVLFEEALPQKPFNEAHSAMAQADLLLCLGSSLVVYPVGAFPMAMAQGGGDVAIVTASSTPSDHLAKVKLSDPLEEVLPAVVADLRAR